MPVALLHQVVDGAPPDDIALVHGDRVLRFGELAARVARTASFAAQIAGPGEGIAIIGDNHPVWVECQYGIPAAGRVAVFLNHRLAPPELASILARSRARAVIGSGAELARLPPGIPSWSFEAWSDLVPDAAPVPPPPDPAAPAWLIFTSGTTAQPKGAVLTHASILAAVGVTAAARPAAPDDVYLFPFPLCHIAAYNVVHLHSRGRPVILLDRFDAGRFAEATARHRVTTTSLAATMLASLLDLADADAGAKAALGPLNTVAYGAAPMPLPVLRRAHDLLNVDLAQGYGMTELSGNAVFLDAAAHRRGLTNREDTWLLGAAGKPGPGVAVRTVDDDDRDAPVGEIVVKAAQVMAGYWDSPTAIRDGWLHTGDIGRFDDEGWLYVVDRKKDVIVSGGENVSSLEVEAVLHGLAGVREAAVVGVPDPTWGENVCAVIAPLPGATVDPRDIISGVRRQLAGFKSPRHVVIVDELPKNGAGKVVKADLRIWLAAHPEVLGQRA